jgi:hypothetical protein
MVRKTLSWCLSLGLSGWLPLAVHAQTTPSDPEVVNGIRHVEEGEFDTAIITLDAAVRRLAADPAKVRDLSQAYLYLGIAYVGKGHEAAAKANFREAMARIKDLSLSADKFPPKVIDLFEAARAEARVAPGPTSSPAGPEHAAAPPAGAKKARGGSKVLLLVGGIAVAGTGVALATAGGSDGGTAGPTTTTPSPSAIGGSLERTESVPDGEQRFYTVTTTKAGTMQVKLSWRNGNVKLDVGCQESLPPYVQCSGSYVRTSSVTASFAVPVQQKEYLVVVSNYSGIPGTEPFVVHIDYP